ncbi:TetR/AcrR family transcriptional repressor of lmrAB and yxaGH operons [Bacillus niacini]|jgi:TetR/AcrR family transcriptional regulator, lmrAB and yxaGH operons repressor|uniref:TetR/AcrR family transcriptional repressor of lmrAB and yxaGH operons n=1 Tax=Neobacillus niacini TaxID=86668 RepID=A0A852TJ68_9BACI|nr:TetR/AcrR family transcriptional regulator [Neobacillus niacini]NYE08289.1 TetR/AcrR family transcriptional repressor of lmrAB and yxaGH operons [Neobacillus niacini]
MDTKLQIIDISIPLFQQKGYKGVGVTEIIKACNVSKGSFYHHFPNGKEELLIACLQSISEVITTHIQDIFKQSPTTKEATKAMIDILVSNFEQEGTISGSTITSIVSEMGSLTDPVRDVCSDLYLKMQTIYVSKLESDGFSKEKANSIAVMMNASIEGAIILCLTQKSSNPLKIISHVLSDLFN